jgi:hypothetical protein
MTIGMVVIFAGYAVASYGVVLVRGYDIPWRRWVNPLDAWDWPAKGQPIAKIPPTQLWPA